MANLGLAGDGMIYAIFMAGVVVVGVAGTLVYNLVSPRRRREWKRDNAEYKARHAPGAHHPSLEELRREAREERRRERGEII